MTLACVQAKPGNWLDTSSGQAVTDAVLDAIVAQGFVGVHYYVPLPDNSAKNDATAERLERTISKGLQAALVQHVRGPGLWWPSKCDGIDDAKCASNYARSVCLYPQGAHLAQDLEACAGVSADSDKYTRDWGSRCLSFAFKHRLYTGYAALLSPLALYDLPTVTSYWSDAGHREVATRGVATSQGAGIVIDAVAFDVDVMAPDLLGELPFVAGAPLTSA